MEKYPKKRAWVRGKLKKFLDEKGVTKQFVKNCKQQNEKLSRPIKCIINAFTWAETSEGNNFWWNLEKEYNEQT